MEAGSANFKRCENILRGVDMNYLLPLITGMITGIVFGLFKLPIPAPSAIEGIIGILGIFAGYVFISRF